MEPNATPQIPQAPEVKRDNHWVTILAMALFVLASLSLTGFLYYQNQALKKMLASYQSPPSPTPTTTPDVTANWKTYTNENIKVQFKYPNDWKYEVINSKSNAGFNYTQITLAKVEYFDPIPKGKPLIMISVSNTTNQDLLSVYQNTKITGSAKVDNIPAEVRQHNNTSVDSKYITFTKGEQVFEIESRLHTQSVEQEIIFDQILSTFKFLEASPSPSAKACTQEAKLCPDGSYVGRTGPNCEFSPCP